MGHTAQMGLRLSIVAEDGEDGITPLVLHQVLGLHACASISGAPLTLGGGWSNCVSGESSKLEGGGTRLRSPQKLSWF